MARPFDNDLNAFFMSSFCKFSQSHQFFNLTYVRSIGQTPWTACITQRDCHIVFSANIQDIIKVFVEWIFLAGHTHPRKDETTTTAYNIQSTFMLSNLFNRLTGNTTVQGHKVYPIFRVQSDGV